MKIINDRDKAMLATYIRSALAGVLTLYLAGQTDPRDLGKAFLAAFLPPLLRFLNKSDNAYGRGSKPA